MKSHPKHADRKCSVLGLVGFLIGFGISIFPLFLGLLQQISIGKVSSHIANAEVRKLCRDILWWDKLHLTDFGMIIAQELVAFEIEFLGISPTNSVEFPVLISGTVFCLVVGAATGAMASITCLIIRRMRRPQHEGEDAP